MRIVGSRGKNAQFELPVWHGSSTVLCSYCMSAMGKCDCAPLPPCPPVSTRAPTNSRAWRMQHTDLSRRAKVVGSAGRGPSTGPTDLTHGGLPCTSLQPRNGIINSSHNILTTLNLSSTDTTVKDSPAPSLSLLVHRQNIAAVRPEGTDPSCHVSVQRHCGA